MCDGGEIMKIGNDVFINCFLAYFNKLWIITCENNLTQFLETTYTQFISTSIW